jgi:hypothetical protein
MTRLSSQILNMSAVKNQDQTTGQFDIHVTLENYLKVTFSSSMLHNYHENKLHFFNEMFTYLKHLNYFQYEPTVSC